MPWPPGPATARSTSHCERQGVIDAHIDDLRAKVLTDVSDAKKAQELAGRATEGMTPHYRESRLVVKVDPVKKR